MGNKKPDAETLELRNKTDRELIELRRELVSEFKKYSSLATTISKKLGRIKGELFRRRKETNLPFVSDHAIIRYLERKIGLDIEVIRDEIAISASKDESVKKSFELDGATYYLSKDGKCVTTVVIEKDKTNEQDPSPN